MSELLRYTVEAGVARIHVDNPPVNAFNRAMFEQLDAYVSRAEADDNVHVVVISAAGAKAFVAGIDIKEVGGFGPEEMKSFGQVSGGVLAHLESCGKPVICAVNGIAYGAGFELALACDFRVASRNAVFALPELTLGLIPGGGGTQRLTRLIGEARAKEVILLGRPLPAEQAHQLGLVCDVVDAEALEQRTAELAAELLKRPRVALAQAKRAIHQALDVTLADGLRFEQESFLVAFNSEDGREGVRAFREKRQPVFVGR
ncbi:MAG: enoyl-CoA hydratase/isomerase family protein [Alicyclobacillaceae bacterium]|nr:enoyl-CoA hydratase/isomerase family protein [Alicyclobacillaceae bacterium]